MGNAVKKKGPERAQETMSMKKCANIWSTDRHSPPGILVDSNLHHSLSYGAPEMGVQTTL